MSAHNHTAYVAGCYRCELSLDEIKWWTDEDYVLITTAIIAVSGHWWWEQADRVLAAFTPIMERVQEEAERRGEVKGLREAAAYVRQRTHAGNANIGHRGRALERQSINRALREMAALRESQRDE